MTFDPLTIARPLQARHLKGHITRSAVVQFLSVIINHGRSYALRSVGSKDMGATRELETEGEVSMTLFPVD